MPHSPPPRGVTNCRGPHLSQQHAGLQHTVVFRPQQEATIPKARSLTRDV